MYVEPFPTLPFTLAALGLGAIAIGILLMMEAARRAREPRADMARASADDRLGMRLTLTGLAFLAVVGFLELAKAAL